MSILSHLRYGNSTRDSSILVLINYLSVRKKLIKMTLMMKNYLVASIFVAVLQFTSAFLINDKQTFEPNYAPQSVRDGSAGPSNEDKRKFSDDRVLPPTVGAGPTFGNQIHTKDDDYFGPQTNNLATLNNLDMSNHNSANLVEEITDETVLSRLDLAHLSRIRMETKQVPSERKCIRYDEELRKMLSEQSVRSSRALLSQVVRVLSQRKLPFGNNQPALDDLRECLENSISSNGAGDRVGSESTRRGLVAGPKDFDGKLNGNFETASRDALNEFKEVRKNLKDLGQGIYSPNQGSVYDNKIKSPSEDMFLGQQKAVGREGENNYNDDLVTNHLTPIKVRKVQNNPEYRSLVDNPYSNQGYLYYNQASDHELKNQNPEGIDIDRLMRVELSLRGSTPKEKCSILANELRIMTGSTSSYLELFTLASSLMSKSISPEALPVLTAVNVCLKSPPSDENKDNSQIPTYQKATEDFSISNVYNDQKAVFNNNEPVDKFGQVIVDAADSSDDEDDDTPHKIVYDDHRKKELKQEFRQVENGQLHPADDHFENYNDDSSHTPVHNHNSFGLLHRDLNPMERNVLDSSNDVIEKDLEIRDLKYQVSQLQDLVKETQEEASRSNEELKKLKTDLLNRQSEDEMKSKLLKTHCENASSKEQQLLKQLDELKEKLKRQDEVIKRNFELEHEAEDKYPKDKSKDLKKESKDVVESISELKSKLDKEENLYDRCYRYYLLLSYPKKVNKYVVKTIAKVDVNVLSKTTLDQLINPSAIDSVLKTAGKLIGSSKKKAVEAGNELYSCFTDNRRVGLQTLASDHRFSNKDRSFFDMYYNENSSRDGQKRVSIPIHRANRAHRVIPPIPPMPPMPPIKYVSRGSGRLFEDF